MVPGAVPGADFNLIRQLAMERHPLRNCLEKLNRKFDPVAVKGLLGTLHDCGTGTEEREREKGKLVGKCGRCGRCKLAQHSPTCR